MSVVPRLVWDPASAGPVPSPCNTVCRISPSNGLCEGCWRTIDEIVHWARLDDDARRTVWRELPARQQGGTEP